MRCGGDVTATALGPRHAGTSSLSGLGPERAGGCLGAFFRHPAAAHAQLLMVTYHGAGTQTLQSLEACGDETQAKRWGARFFPSFMLFTAPHRRVKRYPCLFGTQVPI